MPKHFSWKKIMSGAIAFTLITGSAVPVLTSNASVVQAATTGITPFVDIPAGLYAEKHIYRLSLQQIVKGYQDKKTGEFTFQHNNTISQEEAVIMAIRFAGLTNELNTTDMIIFDERFVVKDDYKPYIALAFEKGILDRDLEYELAGADTTNKWGSKAASREWVTKLIIKALGAEEKASQLANSATTFTDNNKIDKKYLGYVNAAVELGLIKGLTSTTFGPTSPINRASFATILSRAQKDFPIEVEGQHYGIVTAITDKSITIYENNKETTYATDATTGYYETDNDFAIDRSKLTQYGKVAVFVSGGVAKFIEAQGKETFVESLKLTVGIVNTAEKTIYVYIDNKPVAIPYNDNVKILNAKGENIPASTIKQNDSITILRDTFRENSVPISITLNDAEKVSSTVSGTFDNSNSKSITVNTGKGLVSKFLAPKVSVSIPFINNATMSDLIKEVDQVTVTMNDKDEVISIVVSDRNMKTMYAPNIINLDESNKLITVMNSEGNNAEALFLTDATRFMIDGVIVDYKTITSILDGWQNIVLRYAEQNGKKVVIYYDLVSKYEGELVLLNETDKIVTFSLPDGSIVKMDYTGASIDSLTDTSTTFLNMKAGTKLTFSLSSSDVRVTSFDLYETHQLTIQSITNLTKEIKFKDSKGNIYFVLFDEVKCVKADGTPASINDLVIGKTLSVKFAGSQISTITIP
ncbi:S-layer homology domain-containing protein [Paenibacillus endoradicis]|uniref:S-layer homology domain-containing protein n=1 Tax=Paenibacillus endoradicis TaxID=2972487 RepID=UPI002158DDE4|nr:S-layer homology domain-containing protein [Paenibacillus endoradicis]MCR8660629.1 S-layer homology domain-containing protein [Paenibacillus endoradicis]